MRGGTIIMYLMVHKRRVCMPTKRWFSPDDLVRHALAESCWPRKKVYLDWGMGFEPIHSIEEMRFAARIVQAYHCHDMDSDAAELELTTAETREIEDAVERHMQEPDSDESDCVCDLSEGELFAVGCRREHTSS